jgi:hypothetical protein
MHLLSKIKSTVVPAGAKPRTIPLGVFRGLTIDIDLSTGTQVYLGLWERETYAAIQRGVARAHWAIDVGGGNGELCVYLLSKSNMERVVVFEPQQDCVALTQRNLGYNKLAGDSRLTFISKFAGDGPPEQFVPLDSLDINRKQRGFIKVDVDGAELDVFRSGKQLLAEAKMDILLETHSQQLETDCLNFLTNLGYSCRIVKNAWWRAIVPEHRPSEHNRWLVAVKE